MKGNSVADFDLMLDTDEVLQLFGPVDISDGSAIVSGVTGSVIRLFDSAKETKAKIRQTKLIAAGDTPDLTVDVNSIRGIRVGDAIEIDLDAGDVHSTIVNTPAPTGATVTLSAAVPSPAASGNLVRIVNLAPGATLLYVESGSAWRVGDNLQLHHLIDDSYHDAVVVQTAANEIEIDTAVIRIVLVDDQVRRKLGDDITMETAFGVPETPAKPKSKAWGFEGSKLEDHGDLREGMKGSADYILRAGAGLNLHLVRSFRVVGKE